MIENVSRSSTDKWLGGVAGGLAERSGLPSLLVRALFVILGFLFNVITVLIYLTLWLVVPESPMIEDKEAEISAEIVEEAPAVTEEASAVA